MKRCKFNKRNGVYVKIQRTDQGRRLTLRNKTSTTKQESQRAKCMERGCTITNINNHEMQSQVYYGYLFQYLPRHRLLQIRARGCEYNDISNMIEARCRHSRDMMKTIKVTTYIR